jgi:molybdopterin-guanine dinucleotide biosynthesis protein A
MHSASDWAAIIAAGGSLEGELRDATGKTNKALVEFGGRCSGDIVIEACLEAGMSEVVVVADEVVKDSLALSNEVKFAEPGRNAIRSARSGASVVDPRRPLLFLAADLPLLSSHSVKEFIEYSSSIQGFTAGLIRSEAFQNTYPGVPAKYIRLREGRFVAASIYSATRDAFERALKTIEAANQSRKSQLKLAMRLGVGNMLRYGLGVATLAIAERAIEKALGAPIKLNAGAHPDIAMDFDNLEDLHYIRNFLNR